MNSLLSKNRYIDALQFDSEYDVRTKRVNASKANLGEFVKRSFGGTAVGDFSSGQALNLTSSITYKTPKKDVPTFGKVVVGVYEGAGTATDDMIYPVRGANVTLGRYQVDGGEMDRNNYNGTSDQWRAVLIDTNGTSTQQVTFAADWIFLDYATDDVS